MENQRTILYLAFFFTLFLLYQEWQKAYDPQPIVTAAEQITSGNSRDISDADLSSQPWVHCQRSLKKARFVNRFVL